MMAAEQSDYDIPKLVSEEVLRQRIREGIANAVKESLWRRLLTAPLTSVVVAGVLGAWLTHYYDTQRLKTENELIKNRATSDRLLAQHETEIAHAFQTFESVSRLLDKRLWRARSLVWAAQENADTSELQRRRVAYREAVNEWNESLNRNLASIERYFGQTARGKLEGPIADGLRTVNAELRDKNVSEKQLIERINDLNNTPTHNLTRFEINN